MLGHAALSETPLSAFAVPGEAVETRSNDIILRAVDGTDICLWLPGEIDDCSTSESGGDGRKKRGRIHLESEDWRERQARQATTPPRDPFAGVQLGGQDPFRGLSYGNGAFGQLEFRYSASADQFTTIAGLRAARRLWDRVGEASGA